MFPTFHRLQYYYLELSGGNVGNDQQDSAALPCCSNVFLTLVTRFNTGKTANESCNHEKFSELHHSSQLALATDHRSVSVSEWCGLQTRHRHVHITFVTTPRSTTQTINAITRQEH